MSQIFETLAHRLRLAYQDGPVPPLRDGLAPNDGPGAYTVQQINTQAWQRAGRRIVGRKIGLTAKAVQAQLGVDQPDFGVLFDDMHIADAGELLASRVLQPKAEAEIALIMGRDLADPDADADTVASAAAYAVAAIEIVDSRIADWKISFADTVADNGSSGFFVLGPARHALPGLDLYTCGMVLELNGAAVSLGAGAAWATPCTPPPGSPAPWLPAATRCARATLC
jgi:2-keto-4-pentenoate hydratase